MRLAAAGYQVHLIDPVPLHVEQAAAASRDSGAPLASVSLATRASCGPPMAAPTPFSAWARCTTSPAGRTA